MSRRRIAWAVAVLGVAASSAAPAAAGAAPARGPATVAFTPHGIHESDPAKRTAAYRRLRIAGVRAIRLDIVWSQVERSDGRFDFSEFDREIRAIRRAGLRVIGLLGYGHPRYSTSGGAVGATPASGGLPPFGIGSARHFPPDDPAPFARFARAAARHYGDEILAWEVWNEQNLGWRFWSPREDPAAYGRLLCATAAALREVERTPVVFGGVFFPAVNDLPHMSGPTFLERAYLANPRLGRCFDALAYHPYAYPFTAPELDVPVRGSVLSAADQMRAVLARHGDAAKPLWITEVGWPSHERAYGVDEATQARYVARMQAASFADRIEVLNWYTYGDEADPSGGANQEAHFGFFRADGAPKPAYRALSTSWRMLGWSRFVADRSRALGLPRGETLTGGRAFALEFRRRNRRIVVVWIAPEGAGSDQGSLPDAPSATVSVPVTAHAGGVDVFDHLGARRSVRPAKGVVWLRAGPGPHYVVERVRFE